MVLEIVGDWCESLNVCERSCKKEEGKRLGLQVQRDYGKNETLDFFK